MALPVKLYYGGAIYMLADLRQARSRLEYGKLHDRDTCRRSCNSFSGYQSTTQGQQGPRELPSFEARRRVPLEADFLYGGI